MGLFDNFVPNTGWLGSAMPQQDASLLSKLGLLFTDPFGAKVPFPGGAMSPGSDLNRLGLLFTDPFGAKVPFPGALAAPNPASAAPVSSLPMNVAGTPQPVANAGMSRDFGGPPAPIAAPPASVPQEAALPPGASPTQGTVPPAYVPQMPQGPGFGDRLMAGANNLSSGGNPIAMLGNVIQGLTTGRRMDATGIAQENQAKMAQAVYGALRQRGMPHEQAVGVASAASVDPKIAEKLLPQALGLQPPTTVEGVIADRMYKGGAGSTAGGLDELRRLKAAEAQGTKEGQVVGETQATAELNLPSAVAQAKEAMRIAEELRSHPGRKGNLWWHGKGSSYLPDASIPGNTDARDAVGLLNQLKGGAFLEAFKSLKGGGQITEVEGKKATDAIARMERSQSEAEFNRALDDYQGVIKLGIDRANQQAGRAAPNNFQGNAAKPGAYDWTPGGGLRQR